jgi:type II secretion system protein N
MATSSHQQAGEALPRPLIAIGVPCAGVLLVVLFMIRGFPYDELAQLIANRIEQNHGIQLAFVNVGPTLQLAGPALEATQLRAKFPNRPPQPIDRALIRPALSPSWFLGEPVFHVELESPSGSAEGTLRWNGVTSFAGSIRDVRPELPPIADWIPVGNLQGRLDATVEISMLEPGPEGAIEFEMRDGSIFLPGLPTAPLKFESLTGAVSLGGDAYAKLTSLDFKSPLVTGSGSGKIGYAEPLAEAPIGFEFDLILNPGPARAVKAAGIAVQPDGRAVAKVSGTVAKPKIR